MTTDGTRRAELRVDVSGAVGTGERLTVAATALLPAGWPACPDEPRTVLFGYPNGYNRRYYDLEVPGTPARAGPRTARPSFRITAPVTAPSVTTRS